MEVGECCARAGNVVLLPEKVERIMNIYVYLFTFVLRQFIRNNIEDMRIEDILLLPEGRRVEFKETIPERSDLARTIVAFSNDAGGELYIGIKDNPRRVIGIPEDYLTMYEEQISNIIFDRCYPTIIPDITILTADDKYLIRVTIYRGSMPAYYLKDKGKMNGTYIRVGSSNRKADEGIIAELERRKRNISFDGEVNMDVHAADIDIAGFKTVYQEKTGEELDVHALRKLELVKEVQGLEYPTNALILFSDDKLRNALFHFAKIECARFKGTQSEEFIDQKSITSNIATQAEEAYNFILRQINKSAKVEGVYTVSRWEYPVKAIREAVRNAVVHRDYSLTGKDIKIAIYDDMVEITSPGLLPPSINYDEMAARQSDARNRVIAPVFKKLGIIDQWGNGLKLIAEELKVYPEIAFQWKEVGLSFQIQFIKKDYRPLSIEEFLSNNKEDIKMLGEGNPSNISREELHELAFNSTRAAAELRDTPLQFEVMLHLQDSEMSKSEIADAVNLQKNNGNLTRHINKLLENGLIERTIPKNLRHPSQKFRITAFGSLVLSSAKG